MPPTRWQSNAKMQKCVNAQFKTQKKAERQMQNAKCGMQNAERKMQNEKCKMKKCECRVQCVGMLLMNPKTI